MKTGNDFELQKLVSDEELNRVFANADFGTIEKRDVVKHALLKYASIYSTGFTARQILAELGLIKTLNKRTQLTVLGKKYLYYAFCDHVSL